MSRVLPFGNIPDSTTFPDDLYRLKIEKIEEVLTKEREGKTQKIMYKVQASVVEPEPFKGQFYFDQFCIGTEDDPEAEELVTWQRSVGARQFKKLIKALGVPFGDEEDSESFCEACKGAEFIAMLIEKTEPKVIKDKTSGQEIENPYARRVRNEMTNCYKLGEKEPGSLPKDSSSKPAKTKPKTRAVTPTAATPPAEGKPAASTEVTCSACRKRVPKDKLKEHVDQHMADLAKEAAGGTEGEEDE